jgi:GR25 family glycosyltransferase involved in LPS biosynthesis
MIPAFVIHNSSSSERDELVKELIRKTKAMVVEGVFERNRKDGCRHAHQNVARLAKSLHPTKHYLVFEDDCVLSEEWEKCVEGMEMADVLYLGYNDKCEHTTFGTHALMISPKARDKILSESEKLRDQVIDKGAYDHVLSKLCRQEGLLTAMPPPDEKDKYAVQKKGLVSTITGLRR